MNLEREMTRAGLTINELARKSGVHHVMIRGYLQQSERGRLPTIDTLVALAKALHCDLEAFAELPPGRPHDCRHTFAANLARAGVPLPAIKELLGHSSIQTTMIYVHFAPDHLRGAVNKVGW